MELSTPGPSMPSESMTPVGMEFVAIYIGPEPFKREIDMYRYALQSMRKGRCYLMMPNASAPATKWILMRVEVDASLGLGVEESAFHHATSILMAITDPKRRPMKAAVINGHPTFNADGTRSSEGDWVNWGSNINAGQTGAGVSTFLRGPPTDTPSPFREPGQRRRVSFANCSHLNEGSVIVKSGSYEQQDPVGTGRPTPSEGK
ncbi:hypothetical protein P170DRAFT_496136 [Aspergillus steynii IBT 23096]|uniref:Uncharacterized protein n=1 Tax=Aspergillus steynii IBT 23096 TaxID=1392250 RepID=A0A2I2GAD5_9EURO|nr:uncharacterized protein P170DRAFT_496136 [Aspergillus steynii IBT 23096]PLB49845.1 hypothetical protein P170DRAFT_496136 [Aspergillus steynii IBT 23096]